MIELWDGKDVKCPYYRGRKRHAIICRGLLDGMSIESDFAGRIGEMHRHEESVCFNDWQSCPISKMLQGGEYVGAE